MPNPRVSRFASFASAPTPDIASEAPKAPKARQVKALDRATPPKAKARASTTPSKFEHMRSATVEPTARAASFAGKKVTRAMTPEEEKDISHDLAQHGRVRSDAERKLTAKEKAEAAERMIAVAKGRR